MTIIAIDPGDQMSAYVVTDGLTISAFSKAHNWTVLSQLMCVEDEPHICVCERIRSYGMPAGAELFETCEWSGRYMQAWIVKGIRYEWHWLPRKDVKLNLCGNPRAKDANIRQAIIDRFGGKEKAIGRKATPGPLWGISADVWSALAVGLTWLDLRKAGKV